MRHIFLPKLFFPRQPVSCDGRKIKQTDITVHPVWFKAHRLTVTMTEYLLQMPLGTEKPLSPIKMSLSKDNKISRKLFTGTQYCEECGEGEGAEGGS